MKIENTTAYNLFAMLVGNRVLNQKKIDTICKDVSEGLNMLPFYPIVVSKNADGTYSIIDGQHRFEVSKRTSNPVYFITCNSLTLSQIAQLNSRGQKWSINDFLNCYAKIGQADYVKLKDLATAYKIPVSTIGSFLMDNKPKSDFKEQFESGAFKINFLVETENLFALTDKLFGQYRFSKDRYLFGAVQKIQEKGICDFEKLALKVQQAPMMMDKQSDVKNYIYNIERLYNFKNSKREAII